MKITGASVNDLLWLPELADKSFAALAGLGMTMARISVPWARYQPDQRKGIDFTNLDMVATAAREHNIDLLVVFDLPRARYKTGWFSAKEGTDAEFAAFAEAVARRYPWITHYEVGNEVNHAAMWNKVNDVGGAVWGALTGSINPKAYTMWLKHMTPAIRRANSEAQICFAGMAACIDFKRFPWSPLSSASASRFLLDCIKVGLTPSDYDAIGYHPYPLGNDWQRFEPVVSVKGVIHKQIHELWVLHAAVPDKPIWITEWGFSNSDYPEDARLAEFVGEFNILSSRNDPINIVHNLRDYAYGPGKIDPKDREANYGILAQDFSDKATAVWIREVNARS